jgi:predicted alpha/beta hydrolase family esterase
MRRTTDSYAATPNPVPRGTVLIVPGYRGSGEGHWQTWLEGQVANARRVSGIDWDTPALAAWASALRREIARAPGPVWLVAHSFGCLPAVLAGTDRADRVAGALLVAPADPDRFSPAGLSAGKATASSGDPPAITLTPYIPKTALAFPSLVVASRNDPWMALPRVRRWAHLWGGLLVDVGDAGHINTESGYGPWPEGLELLHALQAPPGGRSLETIRADVRSARGH